MKIAVVSSTVFASGLGGLSGYGGLEQLSWQRAEGLAKKGHEVYFIAPDGSQCKHATVVPIGPPRGVSEKQAFQKTWQLMTQCDVVIDDSWQKWSYALRMEGRSRPMVLGVCHAPVNTMYGSLPPNVDKPCFVCISDDQKAHFEALYERPARRVYNGVSTSYYRAMHGVLRTDRNLFLARFSSIKGPDIAIDACKELGLPLDLVGDTQITQEPDYFKACQAKCDGKQIVMVGPATRGQCVWWFSQAHLLLHCNQRFREPYGLAPIEAALCGVPCVAWDRGAMRETVKHGETGWLVNSYDELINTIRKAQVTPEVRSRCREWAMQFSIEYMVDNYEQACKDALDGGW